MWLKCRQERERSYLHRGFEAGVEEEEEADEEGEEEEEAEDEEATGTELAVEETTNKSSSTHSPVTPGAELDAEAELAAEPLPLRGWCVRPPAEAEAEAEGGTRPGAGAAAALGKAGMLTGTLPTPPRGSARLRCRHSSENCSVWSGRRW